METVRGHLYTANFLILTLRHVLTITQGSAQALHLNVFKSCNHCHIFDRSLIIYSHLAVSSVVMASTLEMTTSSADLTRSKLLTICGLQPNVASSSNKARKQQLFGSSQLRAEHSVFKFLAPWLASC